MKTTLTDSEKQQLLAQLSSPKTAADVEHFALCYLQPCDLSAVRPALAELVRQGKVTERAGLYSLAA
jgi:hypothetical protein